ncbi:MAG: flavin reductase [Rhodospirillaceae bacterium]|nr:flavin reductase [Rhodospirillaceae bacterium]|tara:strand:- start:564 stop:1175 length:612 start_codon:yes stop_codon:yes gene_type:complete
MFYEPKNGHGLPRDPFKALVAPRPIGWFTTLNDDGSVNLAPYSYFNAVADDPPIVFFSSGGAGRFKDSARNAVERGEFVHNLVTWDLREAMNATSEEVDAGVDETKLVSLDLAPCELIETPRVAASPASFECRTIKTVEFEQNGEDGPNTLVFGEVIGIHIAGGALEDGRFDPEAQKIIARLGYANYAVAGGTFRMLRPELLK